MGIPAERLIRIMKPSPEAVYLHMREHYRMFRESWLTDKTEQEKAEYLGARLGDYPGMDVAGCFDYMENLSEDPSSEDILDLANQVVAGILAWSAADYHPDAGFEMGVYAEYLVEKLNVSLYE